MLAFAFAWHSLCCLVCVGLVTCWCSIIASTRGSQAAAVGPCPRSQRAFLPPPHLLLTKPSSFFNSAEEKKPSVLTIPLLPGSLQSQLEPLLPQGLLHHQPAPLRAGAASSVGFTHGRTPPRRKGQFEGGLYKTLIQSPTFGFRFSFSLKDKAKELSTENLSSCWGGWGGRAAAWPRRCPPTMPPARPFLPPHPFSSTLGTLAEAFWGF